jgi:hypothetical protein
MVSMQANYRRSPKFAGMLLAVIPAWILGGSLAAFLMALMVVAFVSVLIYVAWSHQNENEAELLHTLSGVIHNYNCLRLDEKTKFTKDDMVVVVICDGYERIPESFKKLAREKRFLDEQLLV